MKIFYLPDLGEGLPDAEIREWFIKEGDEVKVDQPIVAMETAKAVVEVPAPRSGRIHKLYGKAGDVINTGAPLVEFANDDEQSAAAKSTVVGNIEVGDTILEEAPAGIQTAATGGVIKAMPAVRALAKKLNVDLATVKATGANGQITLEDVERAASTGVIPKAETPSFTGEARPLRGVRRAMAIAMAQSHSDVVPVTLIDDADIHAWPTGTDITLRVIRALVTACKTEPALNAWYDGKAMVRYLQKDIHIGLALDSAEGLFVPVLKNVADSSAETLRATINRFKEQVKSRTIAQDELKGSTIMLSNVGVFAGRYANPVIVPPIVAILATGRIREEVVAYEGKPAIHRMLPLSLTFDHRAVTGGEAARFLAAVMKDLQTA